MRLCYLPLIFFFNTRAMQCTLCICVRHEMLQVASKVSVYGKYGVKYDRFQGSKGL